MHDPGLFVAMLGDEIQLELLRGGMDAYNGAVLESVIATIFNQAGQTLYYFEKNSKLEVDFLITLERTLHAVEVKTADHPKSKVLQSLHENYDVDHGIKLSSKNAIEDGATSILPIYMAMFLERS
jgi:predicted AAA+ superfamily ATPase